MIKARLEEYLHIRISSELKQRLRNEAEKEEVILSRLVGGVLSDYINNRQGASDQK